MATIRLVPSAYTPSNTSYVSVSNASNMYNNVDHSDNYATLTHSRSSTTSYYVYIHGFNFDDVPGNAIVNSFSVKIKAYESGLNTDSFYWMGLFNNTTSLGVTAPSSLSTSTQTITFPTSSLDWDTIKAYGNNFRIRVPLKRKTSTAWCFVYVYGAEIEVNYTLPTPRSITTSLSGNGTISPSGTNTYYDGDKVEVIITPTTKTDTVTASGDGSDISSDLVAHYSGGGTVDNVLGTYRLISGGFNGSGATYFQGIVGHGVNATQTTSNYYSSSSSTHAVFRYSMAFTNLPSNAVIERVYCEVNGHAESTSQSSEYMCVQLMSGSTEITEQINYKNIGTSNTTVTLEAETMPTVSQLESLELECTLGYYGGAINGATCYVQYSVPGSGIDHYSYTFIVSSDTTIAVTIGSGPVQTTKIYKKINGVWTEIATVYKKVNGSWVAQSDLTSVFDSSTNYKEG